MPHGTEPVVTCETDLVAGTFVDRPNRFTMRVAFDDRTERVYLRNSGGLETVLEPGRAVLCRPAASQDRKTDYDAIAVRVEEMWVTVDATLPNAVFEACVARGMLPSFEGYRLDAREPALPDEGRADFTLVSSDGEVAYVEVKSNTHVREGVAKFPDRPTERGRRHLGSLAALAEEGTESHVVFVVQRPDATSVRPFRAVDPAFADRLAAAARAGVSVSALTTRFEPPHVSLDETAVPVTLDDPES